MGCRAGATRRVGAGGSVKLLLDENLSRRLVPALQEAFPGSSQVALLGLEHCDDREIWEYARECGFVIVTKDEDFTSLQTLHGYPPKLIALHFGNSSNAQVRDALLANAARIVELLVQDGVGLVEIG